MGIRRFAPLGIAVLLVAVTLGTSYGVTSKTFKYNQIKTGHHTIHSAALVPDGDQTYNNTWSNGLTASGHTCFGAQVDLPNKAKMKRVRYFFSSDAQSDLYGEINRVNVATGVYSNFSPATNINNDAGSYTSQAFTIPNNRQTIDNKTFAYGLGICVNAGTFIRAIRIEYTYRTAGD